MNTKSTLDEILDRLKSTQHELELELERLLDEQREKFHYRLRRGKVVFERKIHQLQRRQRTGIVRYILHAPLVFIITAPVIYSMIIPMVIMDLSVTIYQHICFRVYRIPRVLRSDYIVIDRHSLAYLNYIEKFNCVYCGYGNGVIAYVREITARTERYWCPVKHARRVLDAHQYTEGFLDYGDAQAWPQRLPEIRKNWADISSQTPAVKKNANS